MKQQNAGLTANLRPGLYLGRGCWLLDGVRAKPSTFCEELGAVSRSLRQCLGHYLGMLLPSGEGQAFQGH